MSTTTTVWGQLGMSVFEYIMADLRFDNIPMVLKAIDSWLWPEEIALLNSLAGQQSVGVWVFYKTVKESYPKM